jgi:hypothetical protein
MHRSSALVVPPVHIVKLGVGQEVAESYYDHGFDGRNGFPPELSA